MSKKTIRSVGRSFVIPAGTQVVLKTQLPLENSTDSTKFKKVGNVGVVMKCPPHNDLPYLVRFNDGGEVLATFDQLTLRRMEIDLALGPQDDFEPQVIYRCQVGSKAFGLSNENSDDDIRGIFLPSAKAHWSLFEVPEQIENQDDQHDEVFWELEKFLRLALKANPNILETLWTPMVLDITPIGQRLRELRTAFLSKHVFKTYSGYVLSQFRRMKNAYENTGKFKTKHAMHLLRLLLSGIHAIENGEILVDVSDQRDFLLSVKNGDLSFDEIRQHALRLDAEFQVAFDKSRLPEQPDFAAVDQFLISARSEMAKQLS